jgi:hypothetical protein
VSGGEAEVASLPAYAHIGRFSTSSFHMQIFAPVGPIHRRKSRTRSGHRGFGLQHGATGRRTPEELAPSVDMHTRGDATVRGNDGAVEHEQLVSVHCAVATAGEGITAQPSSRDRDLSPAFPGGRSSGTCEGCI